MFSNVSGHVTSTLFGCYSSQNLTVSKLHVIRRPHSDKHLPNRPKTTTLSHTTINILTPHSNTQNATNTPPLPSLRQSLTSHSTSHLKSTPTFIPHNNPHFLTTIITPHSFFTLTLPHHSTNKHNLSTPPLSLFLFPTPHQLHLSTQSPPTFSPHQYLPTQIISPFI